ncbi:Pentatricopeptide repeat-containing protein At4g17616 [Linum perenne]
MPELLLKDSVLQSQPELELLNFRNGKIILRNRALAKLIDGCKRHGRISELSELLFSIEKDYHVQGVPSLCSDVIEACVHVGWLETAHDILDDMEKLGATMGLTTYMTLLTAYYRKQMLKQGMYRDITILWGDMKRNMDKGNLTLCRDLYECLLLNFLRGGYFERVMEIVHYMKHQSMYADKWMYRCEFLKLHKNLYRNLKASKMANDVKKKRIEQVTAFKRWAGLL